MEDAEKTSSKYEPSFDKVHQCLCDTIDIVVTSASFFSCMENWLFYSVDDLPDKYISSVKHHEELVLNVKKRLKEVIMANSDGPIR